MRVGCRLAIRRPLFSVRNCVQHKFDSRRDADFVEDAQQVFLDRVLAEVQFLRDVSILKTFGYQRYYLLLARGKQFPATRIHHPQRRNLADGFDHASNLFSRSPDLTAVDDLNALTERAKRRLGETKEPPRSGSKCVECGGPVTTC